MSRLFGFPAAAGGSYTDAQALAAAGPVAHPGFVASRWYWMDRIGVEAAAVGLNTLRLTPFILAQPCTMSDLGTKIELLSGGGNIQIGIYASDATTRLPSGLPIAVTANISTAAATMVSADITGPNVVVPAGLYWVGIMADNATVQTLSPIRTASPIYHLVGSATLGNLSGAATRTWGALVTAVTYGTWPNLTTTPATDTTNVQGVMVCFKAA